MEELGIPIVQQKGDEILARCPMHLERTGKDDRHPSWSVRAEDSHDGSVLAGTHNCLSCSYSGSFVRLVVDVKGWDWDEASSWVRQRGGMERVRKVLARREAPGLIDTSLQINEASLALMVPPPPRVLQQRRISPESAQRYEVLWEPDEELLIFPIRDAKGKLLGWQEKAPGWFRNYPKDVPKSTALYGLGVFQEGQTPIVVESPADAPRIHSAGIEGAVASFGAEVSETQVRLIRSVSDRVILGLDNDRAGRVATAELIALWKGTGLIIHVLNYSHVKGAKDPGEMDDEAVRHAVRTAISLPFYRSNARTRVVPIPERRGRPRS